MRSYLSWRSSLSLLLCVLPSMLPMPSSACFLEERAALIDIKSSLIRVHAEMVPDSWGLDDGCCSWERVVCNNSTKRISRLDLAAVYWPSSISTADDIWYLNFTVFSAFQELEFLDVSWNLPSLISLEGSVELTKLRYLDLSGNGLEGRYLLFISKFVSLEVLALKWNNITGGLPPSAFECLKNLRELNLSANELTGSLPASLFTLPRLKILDLSDNKFTGSIPINSSSGPIALEVLDLSFNGMSGTLPVKALKNIRTLYLSDNEFNGSLPTSLFSLPNLKILDLSYNYFQGHLSVDSSSEPVPLEVLDVRNNLMSGVLPNEQVFKKLPALRELYLSSNQFSGSLPSFLFSLPHIELLDLSKNLFEGPIPMNPSSNLSLSLKTLCFSQNKLNGTFSFTWLRKLAKLKDIDFSVNANLVVGINTPGWVPPFQLKQLILSGCDIDKDIIAEPHFLRTQHHLEVLHLSNSNLWGKMPNWLFTKEATLVDLDLANNSLTGSLGPIWYHQNFLHSINISMNCIAGQLPDNISSMFPALSTLDVSNNDISGKIPTSLCQMSVMLYLDISNNKFSGEMPSCKFTSYSMLTMLKVSNNELGGLLFGGTNNVSVTSELYLDGNKFEGTLPRNLSGVLKVLDLHDNKLSGKLDTSFWNLSSLIALNLAGNRLSGEIHPHICRLTRMRLLDLSNNNLTGFIPDCNGTWMLRFLNLSGNSLSGGISSAFFNASSLIALDIRYNQFMGNLNWVQYLDNIRLLSLGKNMFEGLITPNLCKLQYLRIIDFSHNKLSGSLPSCIGDMAFKGDTDGHIFRPFLLIISADNDFNTSYDLRGFTFATKWNLYTYSHKLLMFMSGIDLSVNMLDGEIPSELGHMSHIKSLNLSYNLFTGPIPPAFAGMKEIESLDLSYNNLNGPIPWQLTQLCSLEVFSVAYNNLSGCIPNSGQFNSFSTESYLGNINLHNISQGSKCAPSSGPVVQKDLGDTSDDPVLYAISAASFVFAFWVTVAFLLCHPFGRHVILQL